ncbi:hypothetical protein [Jannaschia sp. R86511]|uniref:hypothetical protein n=1 Tax=Jannaschia sp. R86511 TaxID=3093853 RepID=UPI0036D402EC
MVQESLLPRTTAGEAGLVWGQGAGILVVGTGYVLDYVPWSVPATSTKAGTTAQVSISLPRDARIESAVFEVSADAVADAALSSVAVVAATTPTSTAFISAASIDLGAMVTVGGILTSGVLSASLGIVDVRRWSGTGWQLLSSGPSFPDTTTQRLLVQSSTAGRTSEALADALRRAAKVRLPVVPTGLELMVDGRSVWFERQGSSVVPAAGPTTPQAAGAGVSYVVERTDALREAFARAVAAAPPDATEVVVPVTLRTSTPGALVLTPRVDALRVHTVAFVPEGPSRSLDLAEEGLVAVDVSVPGAAAVHEVAVTTRGRFGPERVSPAVGPDLTAAARLVLAGGRSVLIGLPRTLLTRFSTLSGVRLRLQVPEGGSGGQLTGRLLAGAAPGRPGEAVAGAELTPLAVTATAPAWYTLPLAESVPVPAPALVAAEPPPPGSAAPPDDGVGLWLELQPSYGEVECLLTTTPVTDVAAPGAPLRRRLAGGATTAPTTVPAIGTLYAAVRLVGLPDRDAPLPAVTMQVQGSPESLGVTPTADGVGVVLTLQTPVAAVAPVTLAVTCAAPGSLTLEEVRVTYRPATPPS